MSDLGLIVAMAVITYGSRAALLIRPRPAPEGPLGRFLDVFPLALFVAIAVLGLLAPEGEPEVTIALWAAAGGVAGAVVLKRSLLGVVLVGGAAWWIAKLIV